MRALELIRNGLVLCVAGTENASLLSLHLNLFVEEPRQGTLRVAGMNEMENDRTSHTYWLEQEVVRPGEALCIRFTDSQSITPPKSETATDSAEYLDEQKQYESDVVNGFEPRTIVRKWPSGTLALSVSSAAPVVANFESEREFITLSLTWNRWRPDVCRYSLSSFSQAEAIARSGSKDWVSGKLQLNESCEVSVGA